MKMKTKMKTKMAVLLGSVVFAAGACFSDESDPAAVLPDDCRDLARAAGVSDNAVVVGIRGFAFVPAEITVDAGVEVTWVNCEPPGTPGGEHTSTSDAQVWDSPLLGRGDIFQRTFASEGLFPFHCTPHPFMVARLIVE